MPSHRRDAEVLGTGLRSGTAPGAHAELSAPAPGDLPGLSMGVCGAGLSPRTPTSCCRPVAGTRCCAKHTARVPPAPVHCHPGGNFGLGRGLGIATALDAGAEQLFFVSLCPAPDIFWQVWRPPFALAHQSPANDQ